MPEEPENIGADEAGADVANAEEAAEPERVGDDEIHMPPNSWWPLVTSIGIAIALTGVLFLDLPFILGAGLIIMLGGIVMWVMDARKEYSELH
jgi:hypothetical protein